MAARFVKTLVMTYLLKMHGLGAAAPGELPGEYNHISIAPYCHSFRGAGGRSNRVFSKVSRYDLERRNLVW